MCTLGISQKARLNSSPHSTGKLLKLIHFYTTIIEITTIQILMSEIKS